MGLATQNEIDEAIIKAKKKFCEDEIVGVLKGCSYGGKPVTMDLKGGGKDYGKTYGSATGED